MSKSFLGKQNVVHDSGSWKNHSPHIRGLGDKANPQIYFVWPTEFYGFVIVVPYWPVMKGSH